MYGRSKAANYVIYFLIILPPVFTLLKTGLIAAVFTLAFQTFLSGIVFFVVTDAYNLRYTSIEKKLPDYQIKQQKRYKLLVAILSITALVALLVFNLISTHKFLHF